MQAITPWLRDALGEARSAGGDVTCVLALPAPEVPVERLLALPLDGDALLWSPTNADGHRIAAHGRALQLTGRSLASLASLATEALSCIRVIARDDTPTLRLYGGQSYDTQRPTPDDPAWAQFPLASLTLPRWSLVREHSRCTLLIALTPADREHAMDFESPILDVLAALERPRPRHPPPRARVDRDEGRDAWGSLVRDALDMFHVGRARKLVAARRTRVTADVPWRLSDLADALTAAPDSVRFALQHGDATLLGATPERLVARSGLSVSLDALAGSVPRAADPREDLALTAWLSDSAKDLREHALVVDGLRAALAPHVTALDIPASPVVRTLRDVHHLWTPVRATLDERAPAHVLALVDALHPTPALGGVPRDVAHDWIASHEIAPRGWYGAPVGWCDAKGDGEFFVAIRSAVVRGAEAWMYAGAGLVAGSEVDAEWRETDAKMAPMRAALGVA